MRHILFASRYPTSPSEGSFLYDCLKEGLQTKEKLEKLGTRDGHNWDVQASVLGHPTFNRKVLAISVILEGRGVGGEWGGRGWREWMQGHASRSSRGKYAAL